MALAIPDAATFRRAEGLWFTVAPCAGLDELPVLCRRQGDDHRAVLPRDAVRLLSRLSRWRSASELGVEPAALHALVGEHCAFWSSGRPGHVLGGESLDALDGAVALRGNVLARPLVARGGRLDPFPHMPRRGELDDAKLAGMRFEVIEWDTEVLTVAVACCTRHAQALRDLLPRLDGRCTVEQVAPDDDTRAILAVLDDLGLLERHSPPRWDGAPRVTWLAHAGVLYEAAGQRILIDPLLFPRGEPTRHAVRPVDPRGYGDIDAVLITHGDGDHFSANALARLARTTPIVIPSAPVPQPYHVDLRRVLALLGFERVLELDEWQRLPLGDVTVTAAPFRGEDWGLSLPCRTYLVASPALTIYANADSLTDDAVCARLAAEASIDLALVGVTGAAESHAMPPGYGYGHFYTPWIPEEKHDEWVELCNGPREAADAARRIGARYAFGYAAGGASFYDLAYSDRGSHAELAAFLEAEAAGPRPLALHIGEPTEVPRP